MPKLSIQIGSNVFFKSFPDFNPHDSDYIEFKSDLKNSFRLKIQNNDYLLYPKYWTKEDYIKDCEILPMKAGKFLVPEFCEKIGFTIEDLPKIKEFIDNIDDKHSYEKIIYNAYIQNQSFTLTDEQRKNAYIDYKSKRNPAQ